MNISSRNVKVSSERKVRRAACVLSYNRFSDPPTPRRSTNRRHAVYLNYSQLIAYTTIRSKLVRTKLDQQRQRISLCEREKLGTFKSSRNMEVGRCCSGAVNIIFVKNQEERCWLLRYASGPKAPCSSLAVDSNFLPAIVSSIEQHQHRAMPLDSSSYALAHLRVDGRRWNELRRIHGQMSTQAAADGSSYFEMGNTKVVCIVHGPRQQTKGGGGGQSKEATIEVEISVAGFSGMDRKKRSRMDK